MRITLCGSARFEDEFKEWNKNLSLSGHVVYSLACYPSDNGGKDWYTEDQKLILDRVHLNKIANSDAIVVINPENYVGLSTSREIGYALKMGKKVYWTTYSDPSAETLIIKGAL